jgi:hypothetical protein
MVLPFIPPNTPSCRLLPSQFGPLGLELRPIASHSILLSVDIVVEDDVALANADISTPRALACRLNLLLASAVLRSFTCFDLLIRHE